MNKELDFLSLGKSAEVKTNTKINTKVEKKEGLSLFDSLMVNNQKKETSKENIDTKSKTDLKSSEKKIENKSSDIKLEKKESTKLDVNSEKIDKAEIKEVRSNETKIEKPSSGTSLLDRMIIEAKKNVKTLDSEKNTLVSKEGKVSNTLSNEAILNKESTNGSLLDKIISQAKTVISDDSEKDNNNKSSITSELKVEDTKNIKKEVLSNNQDTIVDKNIKDVSAVTSELKEEKKEVSVKKAIITDNIIDSKDDTKKIKKDKSESKDIDRKIENKSEKVVLEVRVDTEKVEVKNTIDTNEKTIKKESITNTELKSSLNNENIKSSLDSKSTEEKNIELKDSKKVHISSTKEFKNEKELSKNIVNDTNKNLSKLEPEAIVEDEQRVDIDKKELLKEFPKESSSLNKKSLMDRLLDNAKNNTISSKESVSNQPLKEQTNNLKSNDVVTNIFLSNQKNSIYSQVLSTKKEGTKVVKEGKNIDDVKKGAEILDLGLKKTSVDIEVPNKNLKVNDKFDNDALLDKLAFSKNIKKEDILPPMSSSLSLSNSSSISVSSTSIESVMNVNVNPSLAITIQNRIIGAQQHMSSMMSDVARNMYENYKAPVTAFRINLFPAQLGHIAILMKNDRENGISISMNMSNSSTLDSFVENQSILKEALNRNFNNNQTSFDLDFNLQDQNSNSNDKREEKDKQNNENHSSNEILETITENQSVGEDLNYL